MTRDTSMNTCTSEDDVVAARYVNTSWSKAPGGPGLFVTSLDFELYWGVRDIPNLSAYVPSLQGARAAVPEILRLFEKYGIHATWATVGFLFAEGTEELKDLLPRIRPDYRTRRLSPYFDLPPEGARDTSESIFFAPSLIRLIASSENQEVGSHTFSHYYCLEAGQDRDSFKADVDAAIEASRHLEVQLKSLVFPRNQCRPDFLSLCAERGIVAYRGNPDSWLYEPASQSKQGRARRLGRLLDAYVPLCQRTIQDLPAKRLPVNVCASRFLRPYMPALRCFEPLRLQRIKSEMTRAARDGRMYHLWWHPHNFGINRERNLVFLESLLQHHRYLSDTYGVVSANMREAAERCLAALSVPQAA